MHKTRPQLRFRIHNAWSKRSMSKPGRSLLTQPKQIAKVGALVQGRAHTYVQSDDKMEKVLGQLSAPDTSSNYRKALDQRQPGTGLWFLENKRYLSWKNGSSNFIWLHGIPGCGKSVLSATILEDVFHLANRCADNIVAYFYFDFNDPQKQSPEAMIRSILSQLIRRCDSLPLAVLTLFASGKEERDAPLAEYLDALRQTISKFPSVHMVYDALDECTDRAGLMNILTSMANWNLESLHMLLTSRKERDIEISLEDIIDKEDIMCIKGEQVDLDIKTYILGRLHQDKALQKWTRDQAIQDKIMSALMEKACGM